MNLKVEHLRIAFRFARGKDAKTSVPVRDVSFEIPENSRVAIVGESGCGKSLSALAIGGLVDRAEISGVISRGDMRIAYIFQNPMQSLNPTIRCGAQIAEGTNWSKHETKGKTAHLLEAVGLDISAAKKYPCELSGGQQQRVMIAMALAQEPDLLIADEPTTALDVTTQKEVLELIARLADERKTSILFITHNLGLVAQYSDFVYVMYAGQIVESGKVVDVLSHPRHPYTKGLLAAVPSLDAPKDAPLVGIKGVVPQPSAWPKGCAFHPRCPYARDYCSSDSFTVCPEMAEDKNHPTEEKS